MKAQARKILALIMAMVMCLSLAAPAFAEAEEAAESSAPAPEAVEVVETEAPEAEEKEEEEDAPDAQEAKKDEKLDVQENNQTTEEELVYFGTIGSTTYGFETSADGYAYYTRKGTSTPTRHPATDYYAWTRKTDDYVTIEEIDQSPAVARVGVPAKKTKYIVTEKAAFASNPQNLTSATATIEDTDTTVKLTDAAIAAKFVALTDDQNWTHDSVDPTNKVNERAGSLYQEEQNNGTWTYYFKLFPRVRATGASSGSDWTIDTTSNKPYYVKVTGGTKQLTEAKDIRDALFTTGTLVEADGTDAATTAPTNSKSIYYNYAAVAGATDNAGAAVSNWYDPWNYTIVADLHTTAYTYDVINVDATVLAVSYPTTTPYPSNNDKTHAMPSFDFTAASTSNKVTTSFGVRMLTTTTISGQTKTMPVTDGDTVKAEVGKLLVGTSWEVTAVSATATNDYWTVSVKKSTSLSGATDVKLFDDLGNNTAFIAAYDGVTAIQSLGTNGHYTTSNLPGYTFGLIDVTKDGSYTYYANSDDDSKLVKSTATLTKNIKALGSVAVDASKVPVECGVEDRDQGGVKDQKLDNWVTGHGGQILYDKSTVGKTNVDPSDPTTYKTKYYVFRSIVQMQAALANLDCSKDKTVPAIQLVVNPTINGKQNDAVALASTSNVWTPITAGARTWTQMMDDSNFNIETVATTVTLEKSTDHTPVTEYVLNAPTCLEKGEKKTVVRCKRCLKELAADSESIDRIMTAVAKNPAAGKNYVYTEAEAKDANVQGHYIADYSIETVPATTTTEGKIVTHYYCNCKDKSGKLIEHTELKKEEVVTKIDLVHGDKWSHREWGTQNTQYARDPSRMFGYSPMVFDVDATTAVPMTEDKYSRFEYRLTNILTLQPDGTYFGNIDAYKNGASSNTAVTPTATYIATATISKVNIPAKECENGSAYVELNVYKLLYSTTGGVYATGDFNSPTKIAKLVTDKKIELVATHPYDISIAALKGHTDANADGKCDNCGTAIEQTTPDVPTTEKVLTADMVTVKALTWTGKKQQPDVTVKAADGTELEEGIDYDVATFKKTDVGTYTLTIKGKGDWTGKVKATVKINKAKATLKKKSAPGTLTANKNKAVTGQIKMTVTGGKVAKYKVTGKVAGVSVNKSGKITVKKANKKAGTLKVKVTMTPDANHTAAKAVTVKVAIKAAKK